MKHSFPISLAIGIGAVVSVGAPQLPAQEPTARFETSRPASRVISSSRRPPAPEIPARLDMHTALSYAVENNFSIRQARERIREQEGVITEVRANAFPTAEFTSSYSRWDDRLVRDRNFSGAAVQNWNIAVDVRQTVYSGGGVQAALSSQRSLRESVRKELEGVVNTALLDVRTRFLDVLLAREQIEVQEQNVKLLREQLQTAKNRFDAGAVSNFDVLRAEVELANALPELITARNNYRTSIDSLRLSLGYVNPASGATSKMPEVVGELEYLPAQFDFEGTLSTAREKRPELVRLDSLIEAREAGLRLAKSGYLPDVSVSGRYELRKGNFSDRFSRSLDGWTVGMQSSWAIFDSKRTAGQVAQARSQLIQAELEKDEFALSVEVEVRRALSAFQEADELVDAAEKVVGQAQEALRLAHSRYGAGTATQLDVLTSQVALVRAQLNKLQAVYNYNVAVARVRQAAGMPDPLVQFTAES